MKKLILKFLNFILNFQEKKHKEKLESILTSGGLGIKTHMSAHATVELKNKVLNEMRTMLNAHVAPIVKTNIKTPEGLLDYVQKNGTKVYKINNADKILNAIGEQEGFITPIKGFRALYLNLIFDGKFSFQTDEMFILRDLPLNIYITAHQFYKWYGWKMRLPGYDDASQEKFKRIWEFERDEKVKDLSYNELMNLKEAVSRDIEAIDFVINLAREGEGAKKSFDNIKNEGSTDV